jgi:hypothetical protein
MAFVETPCECTQGLGRCTEPHDGVPAPGRSTRARNAWDEERTLRAAKRRVDVPQALFRAWRAACRVKRALPIWLTLN